jgi:hypothetical protein
MENSVPATYLQLIRTAWTYISTGALRRLMWMRKGPVIAALYPVGMLILQLLIAVGMGAVPHALLSGFGKIDALVGYRAWGVIIVAVLRWFKSKDNKLSVVLRVLLGEKKMDVSYDPYGPEPTQPNDFAAIFQLHYGKSDPHILTKREQFEHDSLLTIREILPH